MKWIIPVDGTDWYYQDDRRPTIYEAQLMQQISGLVGDELTEGLARENPAAWLAALVVARKRSGMPVDRARKVDPDRVEMEDAVNATYAELQRVKERHEGAAEPAQNPPQVATENAEPSRRVRRAKVAVDPEPAEPAA